MCAVCVETKQCWCSWSVLKGHQVFSPFVWPSRIQRCIFIHVLTDFRKIVTLLQVTYMHIEIGSPESVWKNQVHGRDEQFTKHSDFIIVT